MKSSSAKEQHTKNPRLQTHIRLQTGITVTSPQHAATFIAAAISKAQKGCHAAASSFCFLLVSYVLLKFYLELLLVLRRVFLISALTRCISGPCGLRWKRVPAQKVFLHSRRPTAMGAIAWQRTRRNGQCLLNVYKKELSPRSPDGSPACQRRAPLCQNVRPARVKLQLYPAMG